MYTGKFRQMVVGRIKAALWAMYGKDKIAPRQRSEGRGMKWLETGEMPAQPDAVSDSGNRARE